MPDCVHRIHSSISSEYIHSTIQKGDFTLYERKVAEIRVTGNHSASRVKFHSMKLKERDSTRERFEISAIVNQYIINVMLYSVVTETCSL